MRQEIENYFDRLWPINRSLTGNGNRETLQILSEIAPIQIHETQSGTRCFDWTVPPEWNVSEAWIKDSNGNKIVDFETNNLHLLGYSKPFQGVLSFDELLPHLYTKPEMPEVIPYLTSYYSKRWGFCISQVQLDALDKTTAYEVCIKSEFLSEGSMTWGEIFIPGETEKELLFSTYICHPSMASDVLSGMLANAFLARQLQQIPSHKYGYRFLFIPETIGSINYLSQHGEHLKKNLHAGFVLTCLGDAGPFTYKQSRNGNARCDRLMERVLKNSQKPFKIEKFWPGGSDERQYCSPGFDLPVGSLMRTRYEVFKEYHTSADNKAYMDFDALTEGIAMYETVVQEFENQAVLKSTQPHCEPLLGKRGLYPTLGAQQKYPEYIDAMMWILNLADGEHDLVDISNRSGIGLEVLEEISQKLIAEGLIQKL